MSQRHPNSPPPTPTPLCAAYAPLLAVYRMGELDLDTERSLRQHLEGCDWCREKLATLDIVDVALRRHFGAEGLLRPVPSLEDIMALSEQTPASEPASSPTASRPPSPSHRRVPVIFATLAAVVLVALAASLFALRQRSTAADHTAKVFPLPRAHVGPSAPIVGPDGNIWFLEIESLSPHIARITPDGHLTEFSLPTNTPNVAGMPVSITSGSDGNLWLTIAGASSSGGNPGGAIARMTPSGTITEFPLPTLGLTFATPGGITSGPDGNLWFTAQISTVPRDPTSPFTTSGAIGRITSQGGITLFPIPAPWQAGGIIAGKRGSIWFTAMDTNDKQALGTITTSGTVTMYDGPASGLQLGTLAIAPDGTLWVEEAALPQGGGAIGRVGEDGKITEYRLPTTDNYPVSMAFAPDGTLWVALTDAQTETHDALARVSSSGVITEFPLPARTTPTGLVWGPDGNLWVTELSANAIARINPPK